MADPEDGRMNGEHLGEHLDEGAVHAWLDGQLSGPEVARIEAHIDGCAACADMVAEARGFMAASSRILTGLDGVPARVVPRSRSRSRVWQVRAAAAVIVVALGAAAVLSDPAGRLDQLRRETVVPRQPRPASPVPAVTRNAQQVPQQVPQHEQQMPQQKQLQEPQREKKNAAAQDDARQRSDAERAGYLGDQYVAPVPRNASSAAPSAAPVAAPAAAPPAASMPALAAKTASSAVAGYAMRGAASDSSATVNVARAFSARVASKPAYGRCAGKVVTVTEPSGGGASGGAPQMTTVRLDSVPRGPRVRGFVVAAPEGGVNLNGWWVPAGADSAVVSLNPGPAAGAPADLAAADTAGAIPPAVTRVSCLSP